MQSNNPITEVSVGGKSIPVISLPSTRGLKKSLAMGDLQDRAVKQKSLAVFSICEGTSGGPHLVIDAFLFEQERKTPVPSVNIRERLAPSLYIITPDKSA